MGRRRFTDEPPPPDDMRCRRSDGRDWRCPQPSLPGLSLCVYHHRRSYKNPSSSSSPPGSSYNPNPNPSPATPPPANTDEKKPWRLRIRSSKRPASPPDEGGNNVETPKSERTEDQKSNQRRRTNPDPPTSPTPPSEETTANGNTKMTRVVLALTNPKGAKEKKEELQSEEGTEGRRRQRRTRKPKQIDTPPPSVAVGSERCKRSDGRGWQCKAKASPGLGYCEHHYKRVKLLKDIRTKNTSVGVQGRKKKMLAAAVKRQQAAEKQHVVTYALASNDQEETMQLPKGLMTISPLVGCSKTVKGLDGDKKVGVDLSAPPLMVRPIRSKNCPPEPVGPVKVLPIGGKGIKRDRRKICHRCGENKTGPNIRCLACRKRYFCAKCIKKWYYGMSKAEIKSSCPVCRGCCTCNACAAKNVNVDDDSAEKEDANGQQEEDVKIKYGTSPFSQLLPAINKFNVDQLDELEIEAKKQGKRVSCLHVQMLEKGNEEEHSCNNCGDIILDFLRNCPKCAYKLCITCCQKVRKEETVDKLKASDIIISCNSISCKSSAIFHECDLKCPSKELGGCGNNSSLKLVYLFPAGWSDAVTITTSHEKNQGNVDNNNNNDDDDNDDNNSGHTESRDVVSSRANGKVTQETLSGFL